jgi:hypothetical protein
MLVHYNEKEIDMARKNFLSNFKMDDLFLTLTLREFLYYKGLEREVGTHKCIENFHQRMCMNILEELLNSEYILTESLKYIQYLRRGNGPSDARMCLPGREKKYMILVAKLYGEKRREEPAIGKKAKNQGPSDDLIEELRKVT